jgi:hypothetical protein
MNKPIKAYVDPIQHKEFMLALKEEGLTLSGWLRKAIREYLIHRRAKKD